jgi:hypothetical protein
MSDLTWSQVDKFDNGQDLDAKTLNTPISQLAERTEYLKRRLSTVIGDDMGSAVILKGVSLSREEDEKPSRGNVVYYDAERRVFLKAKASMSLYDDFTSSNSALVVGVLIDECDMLGNVLVYGKLNLWASVLNISNMLEDGAEFRPGRYYLSSREAGKVTSDPTGPLVYIGSFGGTVVGSGFEEGSMAVVNPQFLDIGTSHVHRVAVLAARPAGQLDANGRVVGYYAGGSTNTSLLFGGTWTSDGSAEYSFYLTVANGTVRLCWAENESGVPITPNGEYVSVSNGLKAKLIYTGSGDPENGITWSSLEFPMAGRGWINHDEMEGDEASGAKYEYVIGMDPQVANYWPPVPAKSAALVVNGVEVDNGALFPEAPTVSFGSRTIYWYEDAEGRKPWPEVDGQETARWSEFDPSQDKTEVMHWVRSFQSATGPVTSLQVKPGSPLKIYGYGTSDYANTGDLEIAADFDFEVTDGGLPGYTVPKKGKDGKLIAGPVVEKIVAGPGISITSQEGNPDGQGVVTVSLGDAVAQHFGDIALENAEQSKLGMFPYIRLKGYQQGASSIVPAAFTATMRVPMSVPEGKYAIKMQATVFGEASFSDASDRSMAGITLDYNILPDYAFAESEAYQNLKNGLVKPTSPRKLTIPFGRLVGSSYKYDAFDPVIVATDGYGDDQDDIISNALGRVIPSRYDFVDQTRFRDLKPGYLVGVRISRAIPEGVVNEYRNAIGFINLSWTLVSAEE